MVGKIKGVEVRQLVHITIDGHSQQEEREG